MASSANVYYSWKIVLCLILIINFVAESNHIGRNTSAVKYRQQEHTQKRRYSSKFSIEDLLTTQFETKTSNDIDLDPCKAGGFMGDIALPNVNYDPVEWKSPRFNKSFQQELEILKQEVYNEGLQVEEEGLTDIIRKKTKLPSPNNEESNERSRNDPVVSGNEPIKGPDPQRGNYLKNGIITKHREHQSTYVRNGNYGPKQVQPNLDVTTEPVTSPLPLEKINKSSSGVHRHSDHRKIQSDTKDIEDDSGHNFVADRKVIILLTSPPTPRSTLPNVFSNAGGNGGKLDDVEFIEADGVVRRRHRRRRQRRRSTSHSFEYKKKLEQLKEELNRPILSVDDVRKQQRNPGGIHNSRTTITPKTTDLVLTSAGNRKLDKNSKKSQMHHNRKTRAVTAKKERIWDYGVIPYEIDGNFSGSHKALFKQAMRHWENSTCIKFVERDPDLHPNYIIFTVRNCGCCSFVGKRGNGGQAISIGKNCDKFGIVVHELGHVVGFWHEHTRPDRERHVVIEHNNIMKGQDYNFNMLTPDDVDSLGMPYDYDSIMHYARNTFSKGTYLDTILPIEVKGRKRPEIGQRVKLSGGDIAQANLLYKCPKCGRTFQDNNGAFWSPTYNFSSYYSRINESERCEWRITATHGERIVLHLHNMSLFKSEKCHHDYIEVRDGYWFKSPLLGRYCGSIEYEMITTVSSRLLITYVNTRRGLGYRGFSAHYEAICGGNVYIENDGRLESPNYPLEYLPGKECIWRITVPEGYQVALKFQSFEVENHDNCAYDYVEVRDGLRNDSRLIGVFCGYKPPPNMKSSSNKMFVKFFSDGSVQKAGFSAIFMKEIDECESPDHGCEHECINTLGGYECSCYIGYELHSDKKSCEDACGGVLEATNGTITSPWFPDTYPVSKECIWEIIAPPRYKVSLNFTHFDLEGTTHQQSDCGYDSVSIYSKLSENRLKRIGTYCGSRIPPVSTSEGNALRIEFSSDKSVQKTGFAAVFFTDIDECATDNGGCQHECRNTIGSYLCLCNNGYTLHENGLDCKEGECKYEITTPYGNIFSPNYPDKYPPDLDCVWHFSTPPGHRIKLIFNEFDVESHQECAYDHVIIYDGESEESQNLGRFCGDKIPYPISASSNQLYMVLKTDKNREHNGFSATHSTACGGYLRATNNIQQFYSHARYAYQDYEPHMDCEWTIQAEHGSNVRLFFLNFELEEYENCTYDYVEVYDGMEDTSGPLYGRFCGNKNPAEIISITDSLVVRFKTDDSMSRKGFTASYVGVDPLNKSEEMNSDSREMVTPFPGSLKSIYKTDSEEYSEYRDYSENQLSYSNRKRKNRRYNTF